MKKKDHIRAGPPPSPLLCGQLSGFQNKLSLMWFWMDPTPYAADIQEIFFFFFYVCLPVIGLFGHFLALFGLRSTQKWVIWD